MDKANAETEQQNPLKSKTVITGLAAVLSGVVMAATGYALPVDAAQLITTGLIGIFLRIRKA
jgi:hypothetical protein